MQRHVRPSKNVAVTTSLILNFEHFDRNFFFVWPSSKRIPRLPSHLLWGRLLIYQHFVIVVLSPSLISDGIAVLCQICQSNSSGPGRNFSSPCQAPKKHSSMPANQPADQEPSRSSQTIDCNSPMSTILYIHTYYNNKQHTEEKNWNLPGAPRPNRNWSPRIKRGDKNPWNYRQTLIWRLQVLASHCYLYVNHLETHTLEKEAFSLICFVNHHDSLVDRKSSSVTESMTESTKFPAMRMGLLWSHCQPPQVAAFRPLHFLTGPSENLWLNAAAEKKWKTKRITFHLSSTNFVQGTRSRSLALYLSLSLPLKKKILVKLKTTTHSTREFRQPIFLKSLMARRLPARWKLIRFSRLKRRILQTNFSLISIICSQGPLRGLRVKKQNDSTGAVLAIARRISTRTHYSSSSSVFAACNHGNILMNTWSLVRLSLLFPKLLSSWSRFSLSQFMFFCACMCAVWYKKFGKRNEKKSAKVCKLLHTTRDTRKKFKFILQIMQKQRKIIRKHTSLPANW